MAELFEMNKPQGEIIDIDLTPVAKKAIRINKDDNRILYLNTSDMSIGARLEEAYPQMKQIMMEMQQTAKGTAIVDEAAIDKLEDTELEEAITNATGTTEAILNADARMRALLDYIFDSNVSEICAPEGTMYDMFEGTFRFEYIIESLLKLYTTKLETEYKKLKAEIGKHTAKYKKG